MSQLTSIIKTLSKILRNAVNTPSTQGSLFDSDPKIITKNKNGA